MIQKIIFSLLFLCNGLSASNFTDEQYDRVESLFSKGTDHFDHLALFIRKTLLPNIASKNAFLDIGAGRGYIADRLSSLFKTTTVVDPNATFLTNYQRQNYLVYNANFQDVQLPGLYDLVLCSHVLYFVDDWTSFIQKLYGCIQEGGKGVMVLNAPSGVWHDLCSELNSNYSNSAKILDVCNQLNIPYEKNTVKYVLKLPKYEDFRDVVYLFAIDNCFTKQQFDSLSGDQSDLIYQKIDAFIEKCRRPDGSYKTVIESDFIVLDGAGKARSNG